MSNDFQVNQLLQALENESNSSIMNLTTRKIKEHKNNILQRLQLSGKDLKVLHKKLKHYRYCTDLSDIQFGYYIRWIPLKDPNNIYLTNGAHVCDVKIINSQLHILCKNGLNRMMQIKFDEVIIFQKLADQERVILGVLDYLDN